MSLKVRRETVLSGDIGGTNSRFMLHEIKITDPSLFKSQFKSIDDLPSTLILNKKYENKDFPSFMDVLKQFLKDAGVANPPLTACFAVAGPVQDNVVRFTNRDLWSVDGDIVASELNIAVVKLVNDFLAVGYGLLTLNEGTECVTLQAAPKQSNAPIACIGAGTGLGECFLVPDSSGSYQCYPSEGGHAEFAPRNEVEIGLLRYLKNKFGHQHRISVERIASGPGLVNVYEYLAHTYPDLVDTQLHERIMAAGELKGAVIATSPQDELCQQTMKIFITAYGSEAGVAALKWLPYGGLYLTGGLTPKNIALIQDPEGPFMAALLDKGRVSGMLCTIPIYAVLVENLGERGAHFTAAKLLHELETSRLAHEDESASEKVSAKVAPGISQVVVTQTPSTNSSSFLTNLLWLVVGAGSAGLFVWLKNRKHF